MGVVTPEGKVKMFVRKFMQKHFPGHFYYSPMGGAFGKAGIPDHLYLWKGILIAIEVKADKGRLSDLQAQTLKQMTEQGALCAVVYGKDEAKMMRIKAAIDAEVAKRFGAQNVAISSV
jgi:hypothetical protein